MMENESMYSSSESVRMLKSVRELLTEEIESERALIEPDAMRFSYRKGEFPHYERWCKLTTAIDAIDNLIAKYTK